MVSDEGREGRKHLSDFQDPEKLVPAILTTSQLLTTGVDIPDCRNVVLFKPIESMVEFKQIIGRGTRLLPEKDKLFFTILDYVGATRMFADPEFDGDPEVSEEVKIDETGEPIDVTVCGAPPEEAGSDGGELGEDEEPGSHRRKFYVDEIPVEIGAEAVYQIDPNGKRLRLGSYLEYSSDQIRKLFADASELRSRWSSDDQRRLVLEALESRGIAIEDLESLVNQPEADPLDLLVHVAWNAPLRTRRQRTEGVLRGNQGFFEKYSPTAREVLHGLLQKYAEHGPTQLHDLRVLEVDPLSRYGSPVEIAKLFGGPKALQNAVAELERIIYAA